MNAANRIASSHTSILLSLLAACGAPDGPDAPGPAPEPAPAAADGDRARLPSAIAPLARPRAWTPLLVENRGQTDPRVRYFARGSGRSIYFTDAGVVTVWARPDGGAASLTLRLAGAATVRPEARAAAGPRTSWFLGDDPARWAADLPAYREVVYRQPWPGVDLTFSAEQGRLKYQLELASGARLPDTVFAHEGADVAIDAGGNLRLSGPAGELIDDRPFAWQDLPGGRQAVAIEFVRRPGGVGFTLGEHDATVPLVIDPGLSWASYLGGDGNAENLLDLVLDPAGNVTVTGITHSLDFPTTPGVFDRGLGGSADIYVSQFSPAGALVWSTFVGGHAVGPTSRRVYGGIARDGAGSFYVTGGTNSIDFPTTTGAYDRTDNPGQDAFLFKLNGSGTALVYATYLGGAGDDYGEDVAVDASGNAYVFGTTDSEEYGDFPITPGVVGDEFVANGEENFLTKFNAAGNALVYSTFIHNIGATGTELVVDAAGNAYLTANAYSNVVTTPGAWSRQHNPDCGWVAKLNPTATAWVYATAIESDNSVTTAEGLAVDAAGHAYVVGRHRCVDVACAGWPTGRSGPYVLKLSPTGSAPLHVTTIGDLATTSLWDVALDPADQAYVVGQTTSAAFPVTADAYDATHNGGTDAVVLRFSPTLELGWASYLGGAGNDALTAVAVDADGDAYVGGTSASADFPATPGAFDTSPATGTDAVVARLDLTLPAGPCGDGRLNAGEQCDDGNGADADGCDNACRRDGDKYYLATSTARTLGGQSFNKEDLFTYSTSTGQFARYFDGGPAGMPSGKQIDALAILPDGRLVMSLKYAGTLPGNLAVDDSDLFTWTRPAGARPPYGAGGSYAMYFDASDVGLDTEDEDVDVVAHLADGSLLISTYGTATAGGLTWQDGDLVRFSPTRLGQDTAGTFSIYLDGDTAGLTTYFRGSTLINEDLNSVALRSDGRLVTSIDAFYDVPGIPFSSGVDDDDLQLFTPTRLGEVSAGTFARVLDGDLLGMGSSDFSALHVSSPPPPACADDGNPCTSEFYLPAAACTTAANASPCEDGDACTSGDACSAGACAGGGPTVCQDGNTCTADTCDPARGCVFPEDPAVCVCGNGQLEGGASGEQCDDGNTRAADGCSAACRRELLIATKSDTLTLPGGVVAADEDLILYDPGANTWAIALDGSAQGLAAGAAIDAFSGSADGSYLISFESPLAVPGVPGTTDDSDVVRFRPGAGWSMVFDASDVGLDQSTENVDALAELGDGSLVLSTTGQATSSAASGNLTWQDTDLVRFSATSSGDVTAGTFSLILDGSDVGLADNSGEDIDGVSPLADGTWLLSIDSSGSLPGAGGTTVAPADEDVIEFRPTALGELTAGTFALRIDFSTLGYGDDLADLHGGPPPTPCADDGNPCTDDWFFPGAGCTYPFNRAPCEDGDLCTLSDACQEGACVAGPARACDDGSRCTEDACDPTLGCTFTEHPEICTCGNGETEPPGGGGEQCDDGNTTGGDGCSAACTREYLLATKADTLTLPGGVAAADEDVLLYEPGSGRWSIALDGSAVGVPSSAAIDAFTRRADGSYLVSFENALTLPGAGSPDDSDVVLFVPGAGWSMYLDASDVGLDQSNEDIDALAELADGSLVLSTIGASTSSAAAGNLTWQDTDIVRFSPTSLGDVTAGTFSMVLDGSDVGLADNSGADLDGISPVADGTWLLSIDSSATLRTAGGGTFTAQDEDLIELSPTALGEASAGTFRLLIDFSTQGYADDLADVYGGPPPPLCSDDADPCTDDWFFPGGGCSYPYNRAPCEDGNLCTVQDACLEGECVAGGPRACGDGNTCTEDACDPAAGCRFPPVAGLCACGNGALEPAGGGGEQCDDGNAADGDGCDGTTCVAEYLFAFKSSTLTLPGGLAAGDEDIVSYNPADGTWRMFLDVSATGVNTSAALDGFALGADGSIYLSFESAHTLPGAGGAAVAAADADVVRFVRAGAGTPITAGHYAAFFDGSDVGLETTDEDVDAVELLRDGRLIVSTIGVFSVPGPGGAAITGADHDLLAFSPTTLGEDTAGTWATYLDGDDVGLTSSGEDLDAVAVLSDGRIVLSTWSSFSVTGASGQKSDFFVFTPTSLGDTTAGTFTLLQAGAPIGFSDDAADLVLMR